MKERETPDGCFLQILGDPPDVPVLRISVPRYAKTCAAVLPAPDRAWLREQLAAFDPPAAAVTPLRWTKEKPTVPGFYFMRQWYDPLPFDTATQPAPKQLSRPVVVKAEQWPLGLLFYEGNARITDLEDAEFAGPIPLPEE